MQRKQEEVRETRNQRKIMRQTSKAQREGKKKKRMGLEKRWKLLVKSKQRSELRCCGHCPQITLLIGIHEADTGRKKINLEGPGTALNRAQTFQDRPCLTHHSLHFRLPNPQ